MAEVLFIIVSIYVVYVIHSVVAVKDKSKTTPAAVKINVVNVAKKVKEAKKPIAVKKVARKKATPNAKVKVGITQVRHPETAEVVKIASSYRMTKRWIKEALVTEGLLDKVYKTNEVNTTTQKTINSALEALAKMDKYKA